MAALGLTFAGCEQAAETPVVEVEVQSETVEVEAVEVETPAVEVEAVEAVELTEAMEMD